jgi:hypothetical protein
MRWGEEILRDKKFDICYLDGGQKMTPREYFTGFYAGSETVKGKRIAKFVGGDKELSVNTLDIIYIKEVA